VENVRVELRRTQQKTDDEYFKVLSQDIPQATLCKEPAGRGVREDHNKLISVGGECYINFTYRYSKQISCLDMTRLSTSQNTGLFESDYSACAAARYATGSCYGCCHVRP
jgi:hypothetical protein